MNYINDIIVCPDSTPDNPRPSKKFWSFMKGLKRESSGVAPLLHQGQYVSDAAGKATTLNQQYASVFTHENLSDIPRKGSSPYPVMPEIQVDERGVLKLLSQLNPHKACGPDALPARVLKETAQQLAPALTIIFRRSLETGCVPATWKDANITPVFKKGEKFRPSNYRPVSLTCICSKLLEHILVSNIMKHLESNNILVDCQHGFRSRRSCETQLLLFQNELVVNMDRGIQTDVVIMDFSKAFDKVPHRRLLEKVRYYGVSEQVATWIECFLSGRRQRVVVDGEASPFTNVLSGVPQGTVLGPVLFLLFINDLPASVLSSVRLFADDCVLYRPIQSKSDQLTLQRDLDSLTKWEETWQMDFNPSKCCVMRITRNRTPKTAPYFLRGHQLEVVKEAKYLGVTLSADLSWTPHVNHTASAANKTLGFLRRNLRNAPTELRAKSYNVLVRPKLEYASVVWSPHKATDKANLEKVQRRAARFATGRYRNRSSVTDMLEQLHWEPLEQRRLKARATMAFRIQHQMVSIPAESLFPASPLQPDRRRTRSYSHAIPVPAARTDYLKHSFFFRVPVIWNSLPPDVVSTDSLDIFRSRLAVVTLSLRQF